MRVGTNGPLPGPWGPGILAALLLLSASRGSLAAAPEAARAGDGSGGRSGRPAFQSPTVGIPLRTGRYLRPACQGRVAAALSMVGEGGSNLPSVCAGMGELADRYDAFLLDQWGVMHDGTRALEGAVDCVRQLAERGKKVVLLSNSSRRVGTSLKKLDGMGFDSSAIEGVVTGGDQAFLGLRDRKAPPFDALGGCRVFLFGNGDDDAEYLQGCGLELALVEEADFVLARGMFTMQDDEDLMRRTGNDRFEMWDTEALRSLRIAASRYIPMVVTNPDLVRPDGDDSPMPGRLGATYEQILAGNMCAERIVHYVGKPHALVYEECFRLLGEAGVTDRTRVCGVGDSMLHDVEGARRAGIDSVFVANGIHAGELGITQAQPGQHVDALAVDGLRRELMMGACPTHVVPHFRW